MKLHAFVLAGLAALSAIFASCSSARPGGIAVTVTNFKPVDASLLESRAILTLRYTNESIAPFGIAGSRHKLYLNGKYVGTSVSDKPLGVPPLQTATQDVTINLENLALVRQLVAMRETQTVSYRLETTLFETIGDEKVYTKTTSDGALDLRGLAAPAAQP